MHLKFVAALLAALAITAAAGPAFAIVVGISGTHSRAEIKSKCDAAGGDYHEETGTGGKGTGYYCGAPNGNGVSCDNKGKCEGFVNAQAIPPAGGESLGTFLTQSAKTLGKSSSPPPAGKPIFDFGGKNSGGNLGIGPSGSPTKPIVSIPRPPVGGIGMSHS